MDRYACCGDIGGMVEEDGNYVRYEDVVKRLEEIREAQGPACVIPEELFEV